MVSTDSNIPISDVARQYLRLQHADGVGPIRLRKLLARFGSVDAILSASMSALKEVEGIGPHAAESIFRSRTDESADRELDRAAACGLRVICLEDSTYPKPLLRIPDSPICLYTRGRFEPTDAVAIAIVGTRRCSHYGHEQALRFGEMLGSAGFTIVSGMARGIDGHAHRGALCGGGRTIAVLGNGLGSIYPREHEALAEEIAQHGAVVSEMPIDVQPTPENFPRRNRIIAGLALGVIVIEAGSRSGALITARLASEYNREVFALPGRVDRPDLTAGVHGLIRDGQAKLITCLEDVLDELGAVGEIMGTGATQPTDSRQSEATVVPPPKLNENEQAVLKAVTDNARDADSIASRTGLEMASVLSTLTALQLKGLVTQLPGHRFVRRKSNRVRGDKQK